MQKELYTKIDIPKPLLNIYQEMAMFPVDLLKNHALNMIRNKITQYKTEDMVFRKKYSCDFDKFKARIRAMDNEENFEWEDDLMDWEFAVTNQQLWRRKERIVSSL